MGRSTSVANSPRVKRVSARKKVLTPVYSDESPSFLRELDLELELWETECDLRADLEGSEEPL